MNPVDSPDILPLILRFLPAREVVQCRLVNQLWNESATDNFVWRWICERDGMISADGVSREFQDQLESTPDGYMKHYMDEMYSLEWDPQFTQSVRYEEGNRVAVSVRLVIFHNVLSKKSYSTGTHYFEVLFRKITNVVLVGLSRPTPPNSTGSHGLQGSYSCYCFGTMYNSGQTVELPHTEDTNKHYHSGMRVGCYVDFNRGEMWMYKAGRQLSKEPVSTGIRGPVHFAIDFCNETDAVEFVRHSARPPAEPYPQEHEWDRDCNQCDKQRQVWLNQVGHNSIQ